MSPRVSLATAAGTALAGVVLITAALFGVGAAPSAAAAGTTSHFTLTRSLDMFTGRAHVVRWVPCIRRNGVVHVRVIHYRVNPAWVHSRVGFVKRAVAKLSAATGLTFHYDGTTSYVPHFNLVRGSKIFAGSDQTKHTKVPLVIAWAFQGIGPQHTNLLRGAEAGVGTIAWRSSFSSQLRIVDGAVVIDRQRSRVLRAGFGRGGTVGTLLLHELGHVVGLQHVRDQTQVMYPVIGPTSPGGYGAGDRSGLRKVGRHAGCMTTG